METLFFRVAAVSAAVSVVLLPLLLASRWRKRYAPHTRRAVWLVIAAVLLAAPLLPKSRAPVQITVPERAVTLPAAVPAAPQNGTVPVQPVTPETAAPETPVQTAVAPTPAETHAVRTVEWGALLAALWLTGGAAVLLWQVTAYLLARRRVMRGAVPCTGYEDLAAELCPRRSVRFFRVDGFQTPMTLGALRPVVLLPQGEVRQAAVRHELIHVRRWDVAWKALLLLACAVHWFNPLVWLLSRRADRDMEASCDAAVLAGVDAAERRAYGELLLETAAGRNIPLTTRFGGGKKLMKERLYDLFHPGKKSRALVAAVLLLCLTAGSLVACQPRQKSEEPLSESNGESLGAEPSLDSGNEPLEPTAVPVKTAPKVGVYMDPNPTHYDPMGALTQEQKDLLSDLPVDELPRQAVDLRKAQRSQFWQDTLIPLAYNETYDVTLYGVVSADSLRDPEDLSLESDGIVLRAGDRAVYVPLPWFDNADWHINPWMEIADFDGDGQAEAAVCTHWGRGTGVSAEALCLFELDTLSHSVPDYSTLDIDVSYDPGSHTAVLSAGEHSVTVEVDPQFAPPDEVSCGSIVNFSCEDGRLFCHVSLDFSGITLAYLAEATVPVIWDGDGYCLGAVIELTTID